MTDGVLSEVEMFVITWGVALSSVYHPLVIWLLYYFVIRCCVFDVLICQIILFSFVLQTENVFVVDASNVFL